MNHQPTFDMKNTEFFEVEQLDSPIENPPEEPEKVALPYVPNHPIVVVDLPKNTDPLDEVLEKALKEEKNRIFMIDMERECITLINDLNTYAKESGSLDSFKRLLLHRIAGRFHLDHNTRNTDRVFIEKTDTMCIPDPYITDICLNYKSKTPLMEIIDSLPKIDSGSTIPPVHSVSSTISSSINAKPKPTHQDHLNAYCTTRTRVSRTPTGTPLSSLASNSINSTSHDTPSPVNNNLLTSIPVLPGSIPNTIYTSVSHPMSPLYSTVYPYTVPMSPSNSTQAINTSCESPNPVQQSVYVYQPSAYPYQYIQPSTYPYPIQPVYIPATPNSASAASPSLAPITPDPAMSSPVHTTTTTPLSQPFYVSQNQHYIPVATNHMSSPTPLYISANSNNSRPSTPIILTQPLSFPANSIPLQQNNTVYLSASRSSTPIGYYYSQNSQSPHTLYTTVSQPSTTPSTTTRTHVEPTTAETILAPSEES